MTTAPKDLLVLPSVRCLCVGIDVAKANHMAGFVSRELLGNPSKQRFDRCPTLPFENSRDGFEHLVETMKSYADLDRCRVLLERTGHYHLALLQYLQEQNIEVYEVSATKRMTKDKTDKKDALSLANALYSQVEFDIQVLDERQRIRPALPLSETAAALRSLVRRRYELVHDATQRKNRLTAICDELFPEWTSVIKDPNGPSSLNLRAKFPTPAQIASADIEDLCACRTWTRPSRAELEQLQALAKQSIGAKNPGRVAGLCTEQRQLIDELRLLTQHGEALEAEIERLIEGSREGQILLSLPCMGTLAAATIIAGVGSIANFESASKLRGFIGWSPVRTQTGVTKDSAKMSRAGQRPLKQAVYFAALRAIRDDTEFRAIYERLVAHCRWDERLQKRIGKNKVIGRICGQYVGLVYVLLKRDHDMLAALDGGEEPPAPTLYNREIHRAHRSSHVHKASNQ